MTASYPTPPRSEERKVLGHPVTRLEDLPLVTGHGRFAGDINFPHQLHMRIVRSNHAHGRIVAVDTAAARALPGIVAVWTSEDIAELGPVDFRADRASESIKPYRQPVLAKGRVRYGGDPVAAVFAIDPYVAEDAAERVVAEIEELPVTLDASAPPGEFDTGLSAEAAVLTHTYGDAEAAFRAAHLVVELDLWTGRHSGVPLETRGAIGVYDAALDMLELYGAAKVPHRNRETLVKMLGRSPSSIHLHESHVGGGFGIRGELYPEDLLVLVAAGQMDRGPARAFDVRQPFAQSAPSGQDRGRQRRPHPRHDGRIFPRPGRLCPHPRRQCRQADHVHADRTL